MTRDEAINLIFGRAARRSTDSAGDFGQALVNEWNLAESMTFERGYPKYWFLLDIATLTVEGGGFRAPLPADFLDMYEEEPSVLLVSSDGSTLTPLEGASRTQLEASWASPNTPAAWSIMEGYILFGTALTVGASVRILYYASEPRNEVAYGDPGQPDPNRWLQYASDLLIGEVGRIFAGTYLRDAQALTMFDSLYAKAERRLVAENTSRKEAARQRFVNGNLYPLADPPRTITTTS